ncbi:MAG: redox-regulated ATPase YchF [Planctomycetes bacterium]|nr:redox-regulated ATPase YchF [Planctomycetota bacterium]
MRIAIIGLPQSGKTTIFNALTGAHKETGVRGTGHVGTNVAVVKVPDERMEFLRQMFNPKKFTLATVEFIDVGDIFAEKSAGKPEVATAMGLLRESDAIIEVVRVFKDDSVPHPKGSIDPQRDLREIYSELLITDLGIVEKRVDRLKKSITKPAKTQQQDKEELEILLKCKDALEKEHGIGSVHLTDVQKKTVKSFCFLTQKPRIVVLNIGEDQLGDKTIEKGISDAAGVISMCGKLEMELEGLEEQERGEFLKDMGIDELSASKLIRLSYKILHLCSFFTVGEDEVRAWTISEGDNAPTAAGKVHTDMARGFIRAEVVHFDDLKQLGSMKDLKAHGKLRLEGKDYIVKDGDIINFRFSV